jgi:hypothetical protein
LVAGVLVLEATIQGVRTHNLASRRQVALTVSPAEATTSAVRSLTSGDDHLSTDDSGHLRASAVPANGDRTGVHEEVLAPVLIAGARTRPSKNAAAAPTAYDVLYIPPVRSVTREKPWVWPTCARCDRRPCGERMATPFQAAEGSAGGGTKATQVEEPDTRQLTAPQTADP